MHDTALTEIKALLTLALLKSGTSVRDIQIAIDIAATTRLMAGEECAESGDDDRNGTDGNVTNIRDLRPGNAAAPRQRKHSRPISGLNGDVKALLSLLLLQNGATSREILAALRMAAAPREQNDEQTAGQDHDPAELEQPVEAAAIPIPQKLPVMLRPEMLSTDIRPSTPKQRLRNEHLAPIERSPRAA